MRAYLAAGTSITQTDAVAAGRKYIVGIDRRAHRVEDFLKMRGGLQDTIAVRHAGTILLKSGFLGDLGKFVVQSARAIAFCGILLVKEDLHQSQHRPCVYHQERERQVEAMLVKHRLTKL